MNPKMRHTHCSLMTPSLELIRQNHKDRGTSRKRLQNRLPRIASTSTTVKCISILNEGDIRGLVSQVEYQATDVPQVEEFWSVYFCYFFLP
ncbi:hypothetical protein Ddc_07089 [Ditylenchus destructor]|nr:hypothetical protein Ddc_07089 [Ditylenchus destructor]